MKNAAAFSADRLTIDCERETERITSGLKDALFDRLKRRGFVVALSGGIDSSVVGALCVKAVGNERVLGLLMPENDSSPDTLFLSRLITEFLDIETVERNITDVLEAVGCYKGRDEAIRSVIPEYSKGYTCKIVLPSLLEGESYRVFSVVVESPDGEKKRKRLSTAAYLGILSASNFKQRVRKMMEYYHADRLNYVVTGTPNRLEYDQGFFVKLGDGAADVKPIAHLYKTQVFQLAKYLGIPSEIRERTPTTDTYSMAQTQEEFFFSLPYEQMDLCLYGKNHDVPIDEVAAAAELSTKQVERVFSDIDAKRDATQYLHSSPILIEEVAELRSGRE